MAWIKEVDHEESSGKLKEAFDRIIKERGKISNVLKVHSLNPDALINHLDLYMTIMFADSNISREERELVAVVVSNENECPYCIAHHVEALNHYWKDDFKIKSFLRDYDSVDLSKRSMSLANYAKKLTVNPSEMEEADIEQLRLSDLSDQDILTLNLIVSYFNFVNRVTLGLGVNYSEEEMAGYKY